MRQRKKATEAVKDFMIIRRSALRQVPPKGCLLKKSHPRGVHLLNALRLLLMRRLRARLRLKRLGQTIEWRVVCADESLCQSG